MVALVDVDAAVGVGGAAGAEVVPPHPVRSSTATMPSPASRLIFRFVKYGVTITIPFILQRKPDKTDACGSIRLIVLSNPLHHHQDATYMNFFRIDFSSAGVAKISAKKARV